MSRDQVEIILKIGAAGGSLTLFGVKSPDDQWKFFTERNETAAYDLLSEEDQAGITPFSRTPYIHSIEEALLSLAEYSWFLLTPMEIHPEFQNKILAEVKHLGGKSAIERWERRLKMMTRSLNNSEIR
jgi:hypothetical protein